MPVVAPTTGPVQTQMELARQILIIFALTDGHQD